MEPPAKRIRLTSPSNRTSVVSTEQNVPVDEDIAAARERNDQRLKSLFEGIFEKYGRDFSDVGDEIDLRTGDIVVNKGHLLGMSREDDIGIDLSHFTDSEERSLGTRETSERYESRTSQDGSDSYGENNNHLTTGKATPHEGPNGDEHVPCKGLSNIDHVTIHCADEYCDDDVDAYGGDDDDTAAIDNYWRTNKLQAIADVQRQSFVSTGPQLTPIENNVLQNGAPEPIWQLPEINARLSTPVRKRQISTPSQPQRSSHRPASPPGAGSLWAIPSIRRRPKTDVPKEKKPSNPAQKRKRNKKILRDWSFAHVGDNSDSDDPLQEDIVAPSIIKPSISEMGRDSGKPTTVPPVGDEAGIGNWTSPRTVLQSSSSVIMLEDNNIEKDSFALVRRQRSEEAGKLTEASTYLNESQLPPHTPSPNVKSANQLKAFTDRDHQELSSTTSEESKVVLLQPSRPQDLFAASFEGDDDDDSISGISSIFMEATPNSGRAAAYKGSPLKERARLKVSGRH